MTSRSSSCVDGGESSSSLPHLPLSLEERHQLLAPRSAASAGSQVGTVRATMLPFFTLSGCLSTKVGLVLVVLGVMHFFNLFVFSKMRRRSLPPSG